MKLKSLMKFVKHVNRSYFSPSEEEGISQKQGRLGMVVMVVPCDCWPTTAMVTTYKCEISQNSNTQELFATQKHDLYKSDPNSIPARKTCNGGDGGSV